MEREDVMHGVLEALSCRTRANRTEIDAWRFGSGWPSHVRTLKGNSCMCVDVLCYGT